VALFLTASRPFLAARVALFFTAISSEFHRTHHSTPEQTVVDMTEAFAWLPKSAYAAEAKPLEELAKKKSRQ
jgi:hypothetical protein